MGRNFSKQKLVNLAKIFEKIAGSKGGINHARRMQWLFSSEHPHLYWWKKILTELHPNCRNKWIKNFFVNGYYGDNLRFLNALVFNRNSPNLPETMFILKIPKKVFDKGSPIPLYGSDKERIDSDAHILPEYMWGYTYRKAGKEYNSIDEQMYDRKLAQVPVKPINYKYGYYEMTTGLKNPILLPKISTITPEKAVKNALSGITLAETNAARNEQSHIEIEGDITYGE